MNAPDQLRTMSIDDFYFGLIYGLSIRGFYDLNSSIQTNRVLDRTLDLLEQLGAKHGLDLSHLESALEPHPIYHDRRSLSDFVTAAVYGGLMDNRGVGLKWTIYERSCFPELLSQFEAFFFDLADHYIECDQNLPVNNQ